MTMVADINTLRGEGYSWQFSDLASKIQTHMGRNYMSTLLRLERQYFEIHFRICKLLFLSY